MIDNRNNRRNSNDKVVIEKDRTTSESEQRGRTRNQKGHKGKERMGSRKGGA